jgi:uncharacterized protein (DUF488 family)
MESTKLQQPTYKRQQFLLAFVKHLTGKVTATDLQKLVFMYLMGKNIRYYDFFPYKYGPFSFQLDQDIEVLRQNGYLTADNKLAAPNQYTPVQPIDLSAVEPLRGKALICKVYKRYPHYAVNSEIIDEIFDKTIVQNILDAKQMLSKMEQQTLFSIGYEGQSVELFINTLIKNNIRLLCDVRRNPLSRKFGFSKGILQRITKGAKIDYTHIPELGIESEKRQSLQTIDDYNKLFADYKKTLPKRSAALKQIHSLLETNNRVALMCYEQDPNCCHRTIIKNYLVENYNVKSEDL